jgi:hypothetical protein
MRKNCFTFAITVVILLGNWACQPGGRRAAEEQRETQDRNSPAFKAGAAAHEIANEAERAARVAAKKLDEGARKAREGWKAKEKEDRERPRAGSEGRP